MAAAQRRQKGGRAGAATKPHQGGIKEGSAAAEVSGSVRPAAASRRQMGCVSGDSAVAAEAEQRQHSRRGAAMVGSVAAASATHG